MRYDGNNFQVFNSSTVNLIGNRFGKILGNIEKDSLYSNTEKENELVLINQRKIQKTTKRKLPYYLTRNKKRFYFHDGLPSILSINPNDRYCIRLTNGNFYFVSTEGIDFCDAKMRSIYKIAFKNNSVFNFFTINDTLYYLNEKGEYFCFSQNKKSFGKLDSSLFKDKYKLHWNIPSNQVFLNIKNKLYLIKAQDYSLSATLIIDFKDFDKSNITTVFYDDTNQKLYLGSDTNGLCIITFPSFKTVKKNSLKMDVFYASSPFNDSSIITSDGLIMNDKKIIDSIAFEKITYNERITMTKDNYQNLWIVRRMKLMCYLKETGYKKHVEYNFNQFIRTLFKDQNNVIWINLDQHEDHMKKRYYKAKLYYITKYNEKPKLATNLNTNISYIAQYDTKTFYLGSEKGLYKYNIITKKLTFIKNTEKINIRGIFIDSGKKIWITTYDKGFFLYSDNTIYSFPKDKNGYLNSSHCILEDKKGFFWIPTNKGLFQVSRKMLLMCCTDKKSKNTIYYHHYNKENGFLTNEFNGGCQPVGNYLKNGNIALPSMNGMVFFNPNKIKPLIPNKELFIDNVITDQKTIHPKDTIMLENNFQRIQFFIDYAYYGNSNNLNIEARLTGTTIGSWEKIGDDRSISFTTLPPGNYTLTVRSLSGFDSVYRYKTMTLIVPPLFYQTLWFQILCFLLFIACIIFLWYMRLYYLKMKNRQLKELVIQKTQKLAKTIDKLKKAKDNLKQEVGQQERLVKSISHDIKSPLKFLSYTVRHLFDSKEIQQDEKLKQKVESLHISSSQLYEYVDNLVRYSTIFIEGKKLEDNPYSLHDLIQEKILIFEKIAASEKTVIINNTYAEKHIKTNNKVLSIIIHNLIDNAVKNTKNGTIELRSKTTEKQLFLTVKDTGKGMNQDVVEYYLNFSKNPTLKNYHQGLHMIIELLTIINGDIKITSEINVGTTIEIITDYI